MKFCLVKMFTLVRLFDNWITKIGELAKKIGAENILIC